jgi:hypothetical protein
VTALFVLPILCALIAAALALRPDTTSRDHGGGSPRVFCGNCGTMLGFVSPDGEIPAGTGDGHRCETRQT